MHLDFGAVEVKNVIFVNLSRTLYMLNDILQLIAFIVFLIMQYEGISYQLLMSLKKTKIAILQYCLQTFVSFKKKLLVTSSSLPQVTATFYTRFLLYVHLLQFHSKPVFRMTNL